MKRFIAILITLIMVLGLSSVGAWADEVTWQEETPLQELKCSLTCQSWNNKIYAFGGTNPSNVALNSTEIYDPVAQTWSWGATMPTGRYYPTSAVVGDKIYIIGGIAQSVFLDTVEIYDPKNDSWTTGSPMPTGKHSMSAAVVDEKIYILGGSTTVGHSSTVEIYDTKTDSWSSGTSMPEKSCYGSATVINKKIYFIGGSNRTVDIYNPETDTWTKGTSMPTPRSHVTAVPYNETIYTIGGYAKQGLNSIVVDAVEIYNTETNSWEIGPAMPTRGTNMGAAAILNKIFVIGGSGGNITDQVISLTLESSTESPTKPLDLTATGGNSVVDLSWGAVSGADSYTVKRSLTEGGPYTVIADGVTDTTYSDTDVVNGTTYYYVVTAVSAGGESENSNEASATPQAGSGGEDPTTGKALLVITMTNGLEKEYDLQMSEVNNFIDWYDSKAAGNGQGYYTISKTFNLGPFMTRTDYLTFDKIQNFEVMQYN